MACLDCSCVNGQTPLLNAIEGGHLETFKLLLESGADPKFRGTEVAEEELDQIVESDGHMLPTAARDTKLARFGSSGGNTSTGRKMAFARGKTDSTMFRAAMKGRVYMTRILAEAGVPFDEGDRRNLSSPLIAAIEKGSTEIVQLLVEYGANVNRSAAGRTPVYIAIKEMKPGIVRLLASHGADLNRMCVTSLGVSFPLHAACKMGNVAMLRALMDSKVELNTAKPADGMTPLHQAVRDGQLEVVKALAFRGADLDRRTSAGLTAVHSAASLGQAEIVRFLASQGADLDQVAKCGTTALLAAAQKGFLEVIQVLAAFGTDLEQLLVDKSACDLAESNGHNHVVVWLTCVKGWPPLQIAAGCRFYRVAQTMLRTGHANPESSLYDAHTLVRVASEPSKWPWGPAVCQRTVQVIKAAMRGWSPKTHCLYHRPAQKAVSSVLHVVERLQRATAGGLPALPTEMWLFILRFVQRQWWDIELLHVADAAALKNPRIIVTSCRT